MNSPGDPIADDFDARDRTVRALESIAESLEKLANPPMFLPPYLNPRPEDD